MAKRSRSPDAGKPCCYRFKLPEASNAELTYNGRRLVASEGRRVKAKGAPPRVPILDPEMFTSLGIGGAGCARTRNDITQVVNWAALTWPELGWETASLPYKVVLQAIHNNLMLVFTFAPSQTILHVGDMHQQPAVTRNGWAEWVGCWRVVIPVPYQPI
jgi:hypothetical protein